SLVRGDTVEKTAKEFEGVTRYGDLKKIVAEETADYFSIFQSKLANFDNESIEKILNDSESKVKTIANAKLKSIYKALGL
ncbi:MAG: hypothetical protein ACRCXZ_01170, partial [Patescibacteria group bacterium]